MKIRYFCQEVLRVQRGGITIFTGWLKPLKIKKKTLEVYRRCKHSPEPRNKKTLKTQKHEKVINPRKYNEQYFSSDSRNKQASKW